MSRRSRGLRDAWRLVDSCIAQTGRHDGRALHVLPRLAPPAATDESHRQAPTLSTTECNRRTAPGCSGPCALQYAPPFPSGWHTTLPGRSVSSRHGPASPARRDAAPSGSATPWGPRRAAATSAGVAASRHSTLRLPGSFDIVAFPVGYALDTEAFLQDEMRRLYLRHWKVRYFKEGMLFEHVGDDPSIASGSANPAGVALHGSPEPAAPGRDAPTDSFVFALNFGVAVFFNLTPSEVSDWMSSLTRHADKSLLGTADVTRSLPGRVVDFMTDAARRTTASLWRPWGGSQTTTVARSDHSAAGPGALAPGDTRDHPTQDYPGVEIPAGYPRGQRASGLRAMELGVLSEISIPDRGSVHPWRGDGDRDGLRTFGAGNFEAHPYAAAAGGHLWESYTAVLRPKALHESTQGAIRDNVLQLRGLDTDTVRVVGLAIGQSVAMDHYSREIDARLRRFEQVNREVAHRGRTLHNDSDMLRMLANANLLTLGIVSQIGILDRLDPAWREERYDHLWHSMRRDLEMKERLSAMRQKMHIVEENAKHLIQISAQRTTNLAEIAIVVLIMAELVMGSVDIWLNHADVVRGWGDAVRSVARQWRGGEGAADGGEPGDLVESPRAV
ncbi:unnamed protein product [Pedinophyceae sp. YPF-701]|nr:unnamed protein product [Pedinophyceae sp. YPF-701]